MRHCRGAHRLAFRRGWNRCLRRCRGNPVGGRVPRTAGDVAFEQRSNVLRVGIIEQVRHFARIRDQLIKLAGAGIQIDGQFMGAGAASAQFKSDAHTAQQKPLFVVRKIAGGICSFQQRAQSFAMPCLARFSVCIVAECRTQIDGRHGFINVHACPNSGTAHNHGHTQEAFVMHGSFHYQAMIAQPVPVV